MSLKELFQEAVDKLHVIPNMGYWINPDSVDGCSVCVVGALCCLANSHNRGEYPIKPPPYALDELWELPGVQSYMAEHGYTKPFLLGASDGYEGCSKTNYLSYTQDSEIDWLDSDEYLRGYEEGVEARQVYVNYRNGDA